MLKTRAGEIIGTGSPLMNEREAARQLGLQVSTLRRWRWQGRELEFIKIGNAVRYEPAEIRRYIDAGRRSSTSQPG